MDGFQWRGMTPASFVRTPGGNLLGQAECWKECRDRDKRVGRGAVVRFQAPNPGLPIPQQRIDDGIGLKREKSAP